jgi:hypothetical protein
MGSGHCAPMASLMAPPAKPCDGNVVIVIFVVERVIRVERRTRRRPVFSFRGRCRPKTTPKGFWHKDNPKISVDSQRFRLEQPISRGGNLGRATPDTPNAANSNGSLQCCGR